MAKPARRIVGTVVKYPGAVLVASDVGRLRGLGYQRACEIDGVLGLCTELGFTNQHEAVVAGAKQGAELPQFCRRAAVLPCMGW